MRTTLALDEDVAAKLKAEARRTDRSFRATVNEVLRRGLVAPRAVARRAEPPTTHGAADNEGERAK